MVLHSHFGAQGTFETVVHFLGERGFCVGQSQIILRAFRAGNGRNDLSHVVIVVDVHQVRGISIDVLSDYIAMVAMAQIDPEVDLSGQSSILNLFSNSERVSHMTDWDVAYLRALYSARQDRAVATHQTREIANTMVEGIGAASEAPAPHP